MVSTHLSDQHRNAFSNTPKLAFIYMIDPPGLLSMAIPLLLSVRHHHPNARIIPYCPKGRLAAVPEKIRRIHDEYDAPITELTRDLEFAIRGKDRPYRHGNKLLAAAEARDTERCIFLDTDTYLARAMDDPRLFQDGKVAVVPESVASFAGRQFHIWDATYGIFGMETPKERVRMIRTKAEQPPYFNAGFVSFPEITPSGKRFGEVWLETALTIDYSDAIDHELKRPWLDQASMPIAIFRSGCNYEEMERWFNYPLDTPSFLPDPEVRLYHYHSLERLEKTGHYSEIDAYVTASGYWRSAENFLVPMKTRRQRQGKIWSDLFKVANERRALSKRIKAAESKTEQRELKAEMKRMKAIDVEMRAAKAAILEEHFYEDGWMNKIP